MAKAMRRSRTDDTASSAQDVRDNPRAAAVEHSEIARRAYELYERRGGGHGRDLDDWFLAENELRNA
jgi:hypothetical protein